MPKIFTSLFILLFVVITLFGYQLVQAADTATVTATVTVQNISVTVSDGSVAYGTLSTNTARSTIAADLNDSQSASNNGNIVEDFNIKSQHSADWTLAGAAGSDEYTHKFCTSSCGSPPTNFTALTTNYQSLSNDVAVSGNQAFDLQINTPTSTSSFDQQSVNVTVQAVSGS